MDTISQMDGRMSPRRVWIARFIAVAVDVVQIALPPLFAEGFLAPFDPILDVATAIIMIALLGWHIAFVPTFIVESLPFADLAPSWTIAVLIVTRGTPRSSGKVVPVAPLPAKSGESV